MPAVCLHIGIVSFFQKIFTLNSKRAATLFLYYCQHLHLAHWCHCVFIWHGILVHILSGMCIGREKWKQNLTWYHHAKEPQIIVIKEIFPIVKKTFKFYYFVWIFCDLFLLNLSSLLSQQNCSMIISVENMQVICSIQGRLIEFEIFYWKSYSKLKTFDFI